MSNCNYPITQALEHHFKDVGIMLRYKKGQLFDRPHDNLQGIYYLDSGQALIYTLTSHGSDKIIGIFVQGAVFSKLGGILRISPIPFYIEALTDCVVYRLSADQLLGLIKNETDFCMGWIRQLSLNNFFLIDHIALFGEKGTYLQFLNWLLFMNKYYGDTNVATSTIEVALTQEQIASFLGVTREYVGQTLRKTIQEKLISLKKGKITINSLSKLKELAEFEEIST